VLLETSSLGPRPFVEAVQQAAATPKIVASRQIPNFSSQLVKKSFRLQFLTHRGILHLIPSIEG
jgi:hypothetical protein